MVIVYAHGARDCPGYPGQSAQYNGHVGGQYDVSESALYKYCTEVIAYIAFYKLTINENYLTNL